MSDNVFIRKSVSSGVLFLPNETRTELLAFASPIPIAVKTCDGVTEPEAHALPAEMQIPAKSRFIIILSAETPGNVTEEIEQQRSADSPLIIASGKSDLIADSKRRLKADIFSLFSSKPL